MRTFLLSVLAITLLSGCGTTLQPNPPSAAPIKIGWISALSGPVTKYGADKAAMIAVEEINAAGGIQGRPLELVMEDGKCDAKAAVAAINKLIFVDGVQFILGGHCSPETVAIAPIAEENQVILLASLSSNPDITNMGDYIFRTTAASTARVPNTTKRMYEDFGIRSLAILTEETSYAKPIADVIRSGFASEGGKIVSFETITPESNDFRSELTKIKAKQPDGIYIVTQAPDKAALAIQQMKELGLEAKIFGAESIGSQPLIDALGVESEGIIFDAPEYDLLNNQVKAFADKYQSRYGSAPPYGILTAESYDAVYVLANALRAVREEPQKVKDYFYGMALYSGASGSFRFDKNGDVDREFTLNIIKNGAVEELR